MTPWYQIRARAPAKTADIFIFGDIGESWWSDETVTARQFVQDLEKLADAETLNIRINSFGGAVADGIAIYNALRRHPAAKSVTVEGVAVSIASLIAMAGDTLDMPANSLMMIHAPWGEAVGNAADLRATADVLDRHAAAMASSYARKTGLPESEMLGLLTDGRDHWYTAVEAKAAGFADTVSQEIPISAAIPARFRASYPRHSSLPAGAASMPSDTHAPEPATADFTTPIDVTAIQSAATQAALASEKTRRQSIRALLHGAHAKNPALIEAMNACLDDMDCTADMASQRFLKVLGEASAPLQGGSSLIPGEDSVDKFRNAGVQSLLARCGVEKPDRGNPYRGMRLHELARACMDASGIPVAGMAPEEFVGHALGITRYRASASGQTSSDFPVILENTMHKLVLSGYTAQPVTYDRFCKIGDVSDFRAWKRLIPGLIGNLDDVNEAGEYLNKNIPDAEANSVIAKRRGNIVTITLEVIINDDLAYISDFARNLGRAGPRTIERRVYALLESNPVMGDGVPLFHASHNNLSGTAGAISVASLDAGRSAMAQQRAPGDDQEYLDIQPAIALCHTGKRSLMQGTVNAEYDPDTPNKLQKPNSVRGIVADIASSPRLSANPWYLFADPNVSPVIEVVFLNGQREPRIVEEESFRTGGLSWRIELPFGVGAIDHRGAWKNPGE